MVRDDEYIGSVLGNFEGKGIRVGYVPSRNGEALGSSGVTIGTGLDLGQQTLSSLRAMGIPQNLISKLEPYLGRQRREAQNFLADYPLVLSREEVDVLDHCVHQYYIDNTEARFDRNVNNR